MQLAQGDTDLLWYRFIFDIMNGALQLEKLQSKETT